MSMLKAIRSAAQSTPTNIVNSDIKIVEDTDGRAVTTVDTAPPPGPRPKLKPMDGLSLADYEPKRVVTKPETPSNNFDLVGDDIGTPPEQRRQAGRARLFASNADRQKAYRDRKKSEKPNA